MIYLHADVSRYQSTAALEADGHWSVHPDSSSLRLQRCAGDRSVLCARGQVRAPGLTIRCQISVFDEPCAGRIVFHDDIGLESGAIWFGLTRCAGAESPALTQWRAGICPGIAEDRYLIQDVGAGRDMVRSPVLRSTGWHTLKWTVSTGRLALCLDGHPLDTAQPEVNAVNGVWFLVEPGTYSGRGVGPSCISIASPNHRWSGGRFEAGVSMAAVRLDDERSARSEVVTVGGLTCGPAAWKADGIRSFVPPGCQGGAQFFRIPTAFCVSARGESGGRSRERYHRAVRRRRDGSIQYDWPRQLVPAQWTIDSGLSPAVTLFDMPPDLARHSSPRNQQGGLCMGPPRDYDEWRDLCGAAVAHLNDECRLGVKRWQVWSQPNNQAYWPDSMDEYSKLYRSAAAGLKAADANAQVGGPAIALSGHDGADFCLLSGFIDGCVRSGTPLDELIIYDYHLTPDFLANHVPIWRERLAKHAPTRGCPISIGEWGTPLCRSVWGAVHCAAKLAAIYRAGVAYHALRLDWPDVGPEPVDTTTQRRCHPAVHQVLWMFAQLQGSIVGMETDSPNLHGIGTWAQHRTQIILADSSVPAADSRSARVELPPSTRDRSVRCYAAGGHQADSHDDPTVVCETVLSAAERTLPLEIPSPGVVLAQIDHDA
ncbi:MAG: hypothetical protein GY778_23720 [bacterium]|nr:hypothetical protein [bacterium]